MNHTRIGEVSVNLDTPPTKEQLQSQLEIGGHSKEEIKKLINGSKLYDAVSANIKPSAEPKQSDKDS